MVPRGKNHGMWSVHGWIRRSPDMKDSCEYSEKAVADSRQGVVVQVVELGEG
jgi:hypothetical protein